MALIVTDKRDVELSLREIVALLKQGGAELSDNLVLKCADDHLSIEAPLDSVGSVLMRVPWRCLVPLSPFRLTIVNDNIVISGYEEGLDNASVSLMEAMLELYNVTNKLAHHRCGSPLTLILSHPELLNHLTQGRCREHHYFQQ